MPKSAVLSMAVMAAGLLALGQLHAQSGPNPNTTYITVEVMHCEGCAVRIGNKLNTVPGVASVQYDLQKKMLHVHPLAGKALSPRALWEAVEKAEDKPIQLQGPSGVFKTKPNS